MTIRRHRRSRRGLAPLELVMAIPILMFALALSVIIGAVACWKVRANVVARDAIFARRWPRDGWYDRFPPDLVQWEVRPDPPPPEWRVPSSARTVLEGPQVTELDHPVFQNPIIRGPWPGIPVDSEKLDHKNHQRIGNATLTRSPAALGKLGPYSLDVRMPLIDGKWQFWQLGYNTNNDRRLRRLYDLLNLPAAQDWKARYEQAVQETAAVYAQPQGFVLDRDDEFLAWYGRAPDFHPRLPRFCSTDTDAVRRQYVERLLSRIDGRPPPPPPPPGPPNENSVPKTMTRAFIRMYEAQLDLLQKTPVLDPTQMPKMQDLQQKIEILKLFLATLN